MSCVFGDNELGIHLCRLLLSKKEIFAMSLLTGYARVIDQQQNGQGVKALRVIKVKLSVAIKNLKLLRS
jgi:hypothetical protein